MTALTPDILRSIPARYGVAFVGVLLGLVSRLLLIDVIGLERPFATLFLVTAATALLAGFGPGLASVVMGSLLANYLLVNPRYSLAIADTEDVTSLVLYVVIGLSIAVLGEMMRRINLRALSGQEALRLEMAERQRVQAALNARDFRFQTLIEHSLDVITMLDAEGRILYISPSIGRVLGYSAEESVGENGFRKVHPEDLASTTEAMSRAMASPGVPVAFTTRARHDDGSWRTLDNIATNFLNDPSIAAVVVNTRDVTERRAMEDKVRDSEARFHAFMNNSPAIDYMKDDQGRYVWGNLAWARQFGRPASELVGQDDASLWPEDVAREFQRSDREALEAGRTVEVVETINGRHFMSLRFPLDYEGKRFLGGITLDVTDRVEAEAAWRKSESMILALADSMPTIVWAAQPDGSTDYFNRRWFDYTGLSADQSYSMDGWTAVLHTDDIERSRAHWEASVRSGEPYEIEYRFKDIRNGGYRWHLGRALPVRDDHGQIVRWYGTCTDIDDQKTALEVARGADQAKTRFLAILSHELRTPLTPVLLSVSASLENPSLSPEIRRILELTRRNVSLESRLIDDLLDVTQMARGTFPLNLETIDAHIPITRAYHACVDDLEMAGLRLDFQLALGEAYVEADAARLQQVVASLIKNAGKFTPVGGTVTVRTRHENRPTGRTLIVEVSDTGIGIDPSILPKMFEAFEQAEVSPWTRKYGGLGLGLAIGRSVIEGHGGTLTAHSEGEGRGATFQIALKASKATSVAPPPALPTPRNGFSIHTGLRILLIEDDPSTLAVLFRLLSRKRYQVTTADSVASAMEASHQAATGFDLIISDIGLPDGNGVDLMRDLQSRQAVPAIALTGYGEAEDIRKSHAVGFHAHLTKPVDFRVLEATIHQVLEAAS